MKPVPAALSLSELWTLKALTVVLLNPIKNVLSSAALGIMEFIFPFSRLQSSGSDP